MKILEQLPEFLRSRRSSIVKSRELLVENWDPTYGKQDPSVETVDVVDFDALMDAIDEFAETFRSLS